MITERRAKLYVNEEEKKTVKYVKIIHGTKKIYNQIFLE